MVGEKSAYPEVIHLLRRMVWYLLNLLGMRDRGTALVTPETKPLLQHIQEFAQSAAIVDAVTFNYNTESLRHVDEQLQLNGVNPDVLPVLRGYYLNWGAYVGEVLRRRHGGRWLALLQLALPSSGGYELSIMPAAVAYSRIAGQFPLTIEAYCEALAADLRTEPSVAALMARRAHMAETVAADRYGITLDYSVGSLESVDMILDEVTKVLVGRISASSMAPRTASHSLSAPWNS